MQVSINITLNDTAAIHNVANKHGISPELVVERLKNIYIANFDDDLNWVDEMLAEDALLAPKVTKITVDFQD